MLIWVCCMSRFIFLICMVFVIVFVGIFWVLCGFFIYFVLLVGELKLMLIMMFGDESVKVYDCKKWEVEYMVMSDKNLVFDVL